MYVSMFCRENQRGERVVEGSVYVEKKKLQEDDDGMRGERTRFAK